MLSFSPQYSPLLRLLLLLPLVLLPSALHCWATSVPLQNTTAAAAAHQANATSALAVAVTADVDGPGINSGPGQTGCLLRPWVCGDLLPVLCCGDLCVNVSSNPSNCGFCNVRCPALGNWGCCNGACLNVDFNPFHCGRCFFRCPAGTPCISGVCRPSAVDNATAAVADNVSGEDPSP